MEALQAFANWTLDCFTRHEVYMNIIFFRVMFSLFFLAGANAQAAKACLSYFKAEQAVPYHSEVTIIIGSDQKVSNSKFVADAITAQFGELKDVKVNIVDLRDLPRSMFKSDYFAPKSKKFMTDFVDPVERSSALMFLVPEYDGAIPGILSYYMNHMRLSLSQKQIALVGLSGGKWGARAALDVFKGTLTHRGGRILGDLQINIENIDSQLSEGQIKSEALVKRISATVQEFAKVSTQAQGNAPFQKLMGQLVTAYQGKVVDLRLNNGNSIFGKLSGVILNENQTIAYVKFDGETQIKNKDVVIDGQDTDIHKGGYSMPVGAIKGLKKGWHKKENFEATGLAVGQKKRFVYESGIVLTGNIKKLTFDENGNLLVITYSDANVKKDGEFLYRSEWGDFDVAIADYIEGIK